MMYKPYETSAKALSRHICGQVGGSAAFTRLLLIAVLATAAATAARGAFAEQASPVEDVQVAGRHADDKSWRSVSPRHGQAQKQSATDKGRMTAQEISTGRRADPRLPCHPDRSKCWRK